ncbi:transmembrane protein [Denotus virus]|nr:transmembrane protein [Denotus virus]
MVTEYEDVDATTGGSSYESSKFSNLTYKASQLRSSNRSLPTRRVRIIRPKSNRTDYTFILLIINLVVQVFNFSTLCYLVITNESKTSLNCKQTPGKVNVDLAQLEDKINHLTASTSTLMNAVSYTLPQVLTANKVAMTQRLNYMISELREIMKLNKIDLDLRLGANRSLTFKSGSNGSNSKVLPDPTVLHPKATKYPDVTLVPKPRATIHPNLPLTKVHSGQELDSITKGVQTYNNMDGEISGITLFDYLGMTPWMKKRK